MRKIKCLKENTDLLVHEKKLAEEKEKVRYQDLIADRKKNIRAGARSPMVLQLAIGVRLRLRLGGGVVGSVFGLSK